MTIKTYELSNGGCYYAGEEAMLETYIRCNPGVTFTVTEQRIPTPDDTED